MVSINTDVEVDMAEIDDEDLAEEVRARKMPIAVGRPHLPLNEQSTLIERHWLEVRRAVTQGRKLSESEVAFWYFIHGRSL